MTGGKRSTAWCVTEQGARGWRLGLEKTLAHMEAGDQTDWSRRLQPGWQSSFFFFFFPLGGADGLKVLWGLCMPAMAAGFNPRFLLS